MPHATHADAATLKRIDTLYRNLKQMPTLTALGVIIPILLLIGAPLGFVYAGWRRDLLAKIDSGSLVVDPDAPTSLPLSIEAQIEFIRRSKSAFFLPSLALGCWIVFIAAIVISSR